MSTIEQINFLALNVFYELILWILFDILEWSLCNFKKVSLYTKIAVFFVPSKFGLSIRDKEW